MSFFLFAGICIDDVEENRRITNRVNALANLSGNLDVFWTDRSFASVVVVRVARELPVSSDTLGPSRPYSPPGRSFGGRGTADNLSADESTS